MRLPERPGPRPATSATVPHQQFTQNSPYHVQRRLLHRCEELAGVEVSATRVSVPGAVGLHLTEAGEHGRPLEFAHAHPSYDGSWHVSLPPAEAASVVEAGWGEYHPLAGDRLPRGTVLLFAPRDAEESDVCFDVLKSAHALACRTLGGSRD
ncbi:phospholipase [Streptomyces sp. NPDC006487]|uniref:luciferase domain-containing protein n=1 Tax=Streptomyces sp. NPDC006487 TaxID=3364748 RepID=UPI0036BF2F07